MAETVRVIGHFGPIRSRYDVPCAHSCAQRVRKEFADVRHTRGNVCAHEAARTTQHARRNASNFYQKIPKFAFFDRTILDRSDLRSQRSQNLDAQIPTTRCIHSMALRIPSRVPPRAPCVRHPHKNRTRETKAKGRCLSFKKATNLRTEFLYLVADSVFTDN